MKLNHDKINREMERLGWSIQDLSEKSKIPRQSIYNWLRHGLVPRLPNIEKMAIALNLDPKDLIS
jgi:ribosome-binding protein aMBF1 (putative translation factor)